MITLTFRAKMKPGKEDEALAMMSAMAEKVRQNEPGALTYAVHRVQDDPSTVLFWESYADDDAFKTHAGTAHMAEMRGSFADLFDTSSVKLERMERVAGFERGG